MHVMSWHGPYRVTISELLQKVFSGLDYATTLLTLSHNYSLIVLSHHANTCRRVILVLEMFVKMCRCSARLRLQ